MPVYLASPIPSALASSSYTFAAHKLHKTAARAVEPALRAHKTNASIEIHYHRQHRHHNVVTQSQSHSASRINQHWPICWPFLLLRTNYLSLRDTYRVFIVYVRWINEMQSNRCVFNRPFAVTRMYW